MFKSIGYTEELFIITQETQLLVAILNAIRSRTELAHIRSRPHACFGDGFPDENFADDGISHDKIEPRIALHTSWWQHRQNITRATSRSFLAGSLETVDDNHLKVKMAFPLYILKLLQPRYSLC